MVLDGFTAHINQSVSCRFKATTRIELTTIDLRWGMLEIGVSVLRWRGMGMEMEKKSCSICITRNLPTSFS